MSSSPFEVLALVLNLVYVVLAVAGRRLCFPVGAIGALAYATVVWQQRLFGQVGLQCVYLLLMFDGWFRWGRSESRVTRNGARDWLLGLILWGVLFLALGRGFAGLEGTAPWSDALATSVSLWAQVLLNQRRLETWLLWLLVNLFYVALYYHQGLSLLALLHLVFLGLAAWGLKTWKIEEAQASEPKRKST